MTPLHMGALHPVETVLVYALAFGPFVVLAGVVWWRRRTDARDAEQAEPQRMSEPVSESAQD